MQAVRLLLVTLLALLATTLAQTDTQSGGYSGGGGGYPQGGTGYWGPNYDDGNLGALYDWHPVQNEVYDFVVIGAGAAGSVVATRLAQSNRNYKILILEAGGPSQRDLGGRDFVQSSFYTDNNGALQVGRPFTRYDVPSYYPTIGQSSALASDLYPINGTNGVIGSTGVLIAKLVGGGMSHNGLLWVRPTPGNLNGWNVTGWEWSNFLPYMIKSENASGTSAAYDTAYRGLSGPIKVSDPGFVWNNDYAMFQACLQTGLQNNTDIDGATREGCGLIQANTRRGVRDSSAMAYLRPELLSNPNLVARIYATVSRILISKVGGKNTAYGVEYYFGNQKLNVTVRKEVILSAGCINTPKVLILSGIGPAAQLKSLQIPAVQVNENVGKNVRTQRLCLVSFNWTNYQKPNVYGFPLATLEYAQNGTGFLTRTTPHIYNFKTLPGLEDPDISVLLNFGVYSPITSPQIFTLQPWTSNPSGHNGTVTLTSSDPFAAPTVDLALLDADDLATLTRGIRKIRQMMATPIAQSYFQVTELNPGPSVQTDAQFDAWLHKPGSVNGAFHYTGSTKMGNPGDPTAVVDPHLRVNGVANLRIVDGSIPPGPLFYGAQPAMVGIGEKGAAIILQDHIADAN